LHALPTRRSSALLLHTSSLTDNGTGSLYVRTCGIEEIGGIHYMRLLGCIFDDGGAFSHDCRKHEIYRCTDADNVKIYLTACQLVSRELDHPALDAYLRAQSLKTLYVLIYRPVAEVAASRQCYLRLAKSAKQGSQKII